MAARVFLAFVAAAAAVLQSSATTYQVGDSLGWSTPSGGNSNPYANWAAQHTFALGDVLVFNFFTGQHTAARMNQNDYNSCNTAGTPISIQTTGPANFTLNQLGPWYFICTESNHCLSGQKLLVNVTGTAGSPYGSPSPPPPPPPSGSAKMPITSTASSIFFFIAMAFLF